MGHLAVDIMLESFPVQLLIALIAIEAITEIIVESEIMEPLRDYMESLGEWTGILFGCGYCMSVWVSMIVMPSLYLFPSLVGVYLIFAMHRVSNVFHELVSRLLARGPVEITLHHRHHSIQDR